MAQADKIQENIMKLKFVLRTLSKKSSIYLHGTNNPIEFCVGVDKTLFYEVLSTVDATVGKLALHKRWRLYKLKKIG